MLIVGCGIGNHSILLVPSDFLFLSQSRQYFSESQYDRQPARTSDIVDKLINQLLCVHHGLAACIFVD